MFVRARPILTGKDTTRARLARGFGDSNRSRVRNDKGNDDLITKLRVNQDRLMKNLHLTCAYGIGERWGRYVCGSRSQPRNEANDTSQRESAPTETGMSRLSLSDSDKEARDWFISAAKALNCSVSIDAVGNIFAVRPGRRQGRPTFAGSHMDTQPRGGRYDGILGILAGIEMLHVLDEHRVETHFPVGVVNWTK